MNIDNELLMRINVMVEMSGRKGNTIVHNNVNDNDNDNESRIVINPISDHSDFSDNTNSDGSSDSDIDDMNYIDSIYGENNENGACTRRDRFMLLACFLKVPKSDSNSTSYLNSSPRTTTYYQQQLEIQHLEQLNTTNTSNTNICCLPKVISRQIDSAKRNLREKLFSAKNQRFRKNMNATAA